MGMHSLPRPGPGHRGANRLRLGVPAQRQLTHQTRKCLLGDISISGARLRITHPLSPRQTRHARHAVDRREPRTLRAELQRGPCAGVGRGRVDRGAFAGGPNLCCWGGDEVADKETDPEGHDRDNLFGVRLTITLLVGAGLSAILGY